MKKFLHNLNCYLFTAKLNCTAVIALIVVLLVNNDGFAKSAELFSQLTAATFTVSIVATTELK